MVPMATLEVSELFFSIQGESTYAGLPCVFIRLAGCNLRCRYCDARYTFEEDSHEYTLQELHDYIDKFPESLIEITGGEPLLQENTITLLNQLAKKNRVVLLETNGSMDISRVPLDVTVILDMKCPDSGSGNTFLKKNIENIAKRINNRPGSCEIKFVISSQNDYEWSKKMVLENTLHKMCEVLFSPVSGTFQPKKLAELLLQDHLPVRLQLQLHTLIWPDITRGI